MLRKPSKRQLLLLLAIFAFIGAMGFILLKNRPKPEPAPAAEQSTTTNQTDSQATTEPTALPPADQAVPAPSSPDDIDKQLNQQDLNNTLNDNNL